MTSARIWLRVLTFFAALCALGTLVLTMYSPDHPVRQDYNAIVLVGSIAVLGLLVDWLTHEAKS